MTGNFRPKAGILQVQHAHQQPKSAFQSDWLDTDAFAGNEVSLFIAV